MLEEKYRKWRRKLGKRLDVVQGRKRQRAAVPGNMDEFLLSLRKGPGRKKVSSKEAVLRNKVTVINFWFTTCKPCVGRLKDMEL